MSLATSGPDLTRDKGEGPVLFGTSDGGAPLGTTGEVMVGTGVGTGTGTQGSALVTMDVSTLWTLPL